MNYLVPIIERPSIYYLYSASNFSLCSFISFNVFPLFVFYYSYCMLFFYMIDESAPLFYCSIGIPIIERVCLSSCFSSFKVFFLLTSKKLNLKMYIGLTFIFIVFFYLKLRQLLARFHNNLILIVEISLMICVWIIVAILEFCICILVISIIKQKLQVYQINI